MSESVMLDRNGRPVTVGARVQFKMDSRKWPVVGTVRSIRPDPYFKRPRLEARVDDGDPANPDLLTMAKHTILLAPTDPTSPLLADGPCGARVPQAHRDVLAPPGWSMRPAPDWHIEGVSPTYERALVLALNGVPMAEGCDRAARVLTEHTIERVRREGTGMIRAFSPLGTYTLTSRGPAYPYGVMDLASAWEAEGCRVIVLDGGEVRDA